MDIYQLRIASLLLQHDAPLEKVAGLGKVLKTVGAGAREAAKAVGKGSAAAGEHMTSKGFPIAGKAIKAAPAALVIGAGYKGYEEGKRQKYKFDVWRARKAMERQQRGYR